MSPPPIFQCLRQNWSSFQPIRQEEPEAWAVRSMSSHFLAVELGGGRRVARNEGIHHLFLRGYNEDISIRTIMNSQSLENFCRHCHMTWNDGERRGKYPQCWPNGSWTYSIQMNIPRWYSNGRCFIPHISGWSWSIVGLSIAREIECCMRVEMRKSRYFGVFLWTIARSSE